MSSLTEKLAEQVADGEAIAVRNIEISLMMAGFVSTLEKSGINIAIVNSLALQQQQMLWWFTQQAAR